MATLFVLIGLPGSGKSTWARMNAARLKAVVVSSDELRAEFANRGRNPLQGDAIFAEVERRARAELQSNHTVILDATHFLRKYRAYAIRLAREVGAYRIAVWFDVPLDVCLQRNTQRTHQTFGDETVPDQVVRRMHAQFQPPDRYEFDEIRRVTE
jgi:predicted kinase